MQLSNIFITSRYICSLSSDQSLPNSFLELSDCQDLTKELSEFLSKLELSKGTAINFILDQDFIGYYHFKFPPISRRKINKILEFEMEDTLLKELDYYFFDYYSRTLKEHSFTQVGVYAISKDVFNILSRVCRDHNLELRWILSLNNLLDLKFREEFHPNNQIFVHLEDSIARIFVYKEGFKIGFSTAKYKTPENSDSQAGEHSQEFLDYINQKIAAIRLQENKVHEIAVNRDALSWVTINERQELEPAKSSENHPNSKPAVDEYLIAPALLNHPQRVNLLKLDIPIIQELKKHIKALMVSTFIMAVCLIVYVGSVVYNNLLETQYLSDLDRTFQQLVGEYLPKGTSKTNAVHILREKVDKLKNQKEKSRKFARREYRVSTLLNEVSLLKKNISSLHLKRFSLNEQSIRFQGNIDTVSDYDQLKERLIALFPKKTYNTKFSQKSLGDETVEFSVLVQITK